MANFVDFKDPNVPVGKRKQAYVKWAVSKGTSLELAKKQANKKFGQRHYGKIFVIFQYDTWMLGKSNYFSDIMFQMRANRYEEFKYTTDEYDNESTIKYYEDLGFKIHYEPLHA